MNKKKNLNKIFSSFLIGSVLAIMSGWNFVYAQNAIPEIKSDTEIAIQDTAYLLELNERIKSLLESGGLAESRPLIDEAIQLARLLNNIEGESFAISNLSNYYIDRGMPDSVLNEIEPDFENYRNTPHEIQIGNNIANAHAMTGNYHQSLEYYLDMRALAAERGETRMEIGITQNIGLNYSSLGDMPSALDHFLNSLEMAEEIDDTLIVAVVLDNIATINKNEGNFEIAENYLERALGMNRQINNRSNQITNHMSLGGLYKEMGEFEKAQENYFRVLEIAEDLGNNLSRMQAIYNMGMLAIDMEEYSRAMEFFEESLELSRKHNIMIGSYFNQSGMADVYRNLGEYNNALDLYERALEIAKNAGASESVLATLERMYQTYEEAGDTLRAYEHLKQFSSMTDSLARTDREKALARQEALMGLRIERENREILEKSMEAQQRHTLIVTSLLAVIVLVLIAVFVLYRKKNKTNNLLIKRTEELSQVNTVKDKLLSVLAHDLRTPLSNMQGVVYMIRENILEKEDIDSALNQIDFQLQQGINTLTNYLEWAQSHKEGIEADLKVVSMEKLVENAIREISKSAQSKRVHVQNFTDENITALADVHMMRVVLRNLLSNAVKFVEEGDRITVLTKEINGHLELSVEDTGQGIDPKQQKEIFKPFHFATQGTMGEMGTGLGLSICREFVEKQGGTIRVESEPGKGTRFVITLKKSTEKKRSKTAAE